MVFKTQMNKYDFTSDKAKDYECGELEENIEKSQSGYPVCVLISELGTSWMQSGSASHLATVGGNPLMFKHLYFR